MPAHEAFSALLDGWVPALVEECGAAASFLRLTVAVSDFGMIKTYSKSWLLML